MKKPRELRVISQGSEYKGSCGNLEKKFEISFNCCWSCHEDHDTYDYDLCTIETDDGFYEVCCKGLCAYHEVMHECQ